MSTCCFFSFENIIERSLLISLGLILYGWSSQKRSGLPAGTHRSCAHQAWTGRVLPQPRVPAARLLGHILATTQLGPQPCSHPGVLVYLPPRTWMPGSATSFGRDTHHSLWLFQEEAGVYLVNSFKPPRSESHCPSDV